MRGPDLGEDEDTKMRCPACGARQDWGESCRRCEADLSLLREVRDAAQTERRKCLEAVSQSRLSEARGAAQRAHWLAPSPETRRLLFLTRFAQVLL
jgi:hypothetical protein